MATIRMLNPTAGMAVASGNLYEVGDPGPYPTEAANFRVSVRGASTLSFTVRGEPAGSAVTTSSPQVAYTDQGGTGTRIAGSTAITANGDYFVNASGRNIGIDVSAGTATVTVQPQF